MVKHTISLVAAAVLACGMAACSSTSLEDAGQNAGRVADDSIITGKVKAALIKDPVTKAHQIEVETFKGTVQLSGFVDSNEAKRRAEELASNVEGVKDVKNDLRDRS